MMHIVFNPAAGHAPAAPTREIVPAVPPLRLFVATTEAYRPFRAAVGHLFAFDRVAEGRVLFVLEGEVPELWVAEMFLRLLARAVGAPLEALPGRPLFWVRRPPPGTPVLVTAPTRLPPLLAGGLCVRELLDAGIPFRRVDITPLGLAVETVPEGLEAARRILQELAR